jgi:hypothetical protein
VESGSSYGIRGAPYLDLGLAASKYTGRRIRINCILAGFSPFTP